MRRGGWNPYPPPAVRCRGAGKLLTCPPLRLRGVPRMNRTTLLLSLAGLLALVALALGLPKPPPVTDTTHTLAQPGEQEPTRTLPLVTSSDGVLTLEGKLSGAY